MLQGGEFWYYADLNPDKYYKNGNLRKNTSSSGYTSVSNYDDEFEKNEAKRKIKIISPSIINNVVKRFEKVMKS